MQKIEAKRCEIIEFALANQALEGLTPGQFGLGLLESYAKGDVTSEELIIKLDEHYKGLMDVKTKVA